MIIVYHVMKTMPMTVFMVRAMIKMKVMTMMMIDSIIYNSSHVTIIQS